MQPMFRKILLITTIMLGWINMPAQAFLLSSDQNLWPVMSEKFTIPASAQHKDVRKQIDADLRRPKYIHMLSENAKPYLYTVFQETRKLHLPAELALLPMIESGYHPYGYSNCGAEGLWQLMPSTAADYGIKMNAFYDGRRSTAGSTRAALLFLSSLYQQFDHNWLLALAAYNAGPGTVMEAIKYNQAHGRPTDFWALPLPKQTEEYIPKLLALAAIFQHPHAYGMNIAPIPNKALTSKVVIHKEMKLKTIANLAHTSVHTVKELNPALRQLETPPHETVTLVLPANKKTVFVKHLAAHKAIQKEITEKNLGHYTVQKGDSLDTIASKFKTTTNVLQKINHIHNSMIRINQILLVPNIIPQTTKNGENHVVEHHIVTHHAAEHHAKKQIYTSVRGEIKPEQLYIVQRGDNLHKLARKFDTTPYHIMQHNHLKTSNLSIGEHLMLPNA